MMGDQQVVKHLSYYVLRGNRNSNKKIAKDADEKSDLGLSLSMAALGLLLDTHQNKEAVQTNNTVPYPDTIHKPDSFTYSTSHLHLLQLIPIHSFLITHQFGTQPRMWQRWSCLIFAGLIA